MNKIKYYLLLLNHIRIIKYIKCFFSLFILLIIRLEKFLIRKGIIRYPKKRRLFCTTGNISLLNALTIIEQLNDRNFDDYLIIESFAGNYNFWQNNYKIAQLHNFKTIKLISQNYKAEVILTKWASFDEVYILNHAACLSIITKLYPEAKVNLFDEGCGSLVNHSSKILEKIDIEKFYSHKYIGKIDKFELPKNITNKLVTLNIDAFRKITKEIALKYPIQTKYDTNDKNILYCGIYWQCSGLSKDQFADVQKKQIEDLISAGYKILFKPHPRETNFYGFDKNPNVIFVDSVMPVEIYNWEVLAVVGMSCSTLIHLPHYHNIPAFSNVINNAIDCSQDSYAANLIRYFIGEYTPNYKELLKLDVKNTPREELKKQINEIYEGYLKDKPLLSQNKKVEEFAKKYGRS